MVLHFHSLMHVLIFFFFYNFSQIWNMLIINIPHNSKTNQQVKMQEVSQPDT